MITVTPWQNTCQPKMVLTEEWQEGEEQTDKDIRIGRVKSFNNVENLIANLDSVN